MKDFNIVIIILMIISFITLLIGALIDYIVLVYIGLASSAIFHFIGKMVNLLLESNKE